jgi:NTE family protein
MIESRPTRTALALQGGGAHGAFAWGVLDRLVEDGLRPAAICGVSSGALLGMALAQGWAKGGAAGARHEMRRLWEAASRAHALNPLRPGPVERFFFGWDMSNSLAWQGWEAAIRLFGPVHLNPLGHNPLRGVIAEMLDPEALASARAPRLVIAATDVETGRARLFDNGAITADALLASCCLPFLFPPVRIEGRAYWDGGFAGNPPLAPLLDLLPDELILVRAQAEAREGVPTSPSDILNRMTEIACQGVLEAELVALPPAIRLRSYAADAALGHLPISSRFNADPDFLGELFAAGREAAAPLEPERQAAD